MRSVKMHVQAIIYTFRVVAPPAGQGAAFEKYGNAQIRSVMDSVTFDGEQGADGRRTIRHSFLVMNAIKILKGDSGICRLKKSRNSAYAERKSCVSRGKKVLAETMYQSCMNRAGSMSELIQGVRRRSGSARDADRWEGPLDCPVLLRR